MRNRNKEKQKEWARKWRMEHYQEHLESTRKWRRNHPPKSRAKKNLQGKKNPEEVKARRRDRISKWIKENRTRANSYNRKWRKDHPEIRIMRRAVEHMVQSKGMNKSSRSFQYVGCSPGFLRNHIESLFKTGMIWENYGEWHVDHIVPLSWFPFDEDPDLLFVASHWTNLQPLWGNENISKGNRFME